MRDPFSRVITICLALLAVATPIPLAAQMSQAGTAPPADSVPTTVIRLLNTRDITGSAGFMSPVWSPSTPHQLAYVGPDGTYIYTLADGTHRRIGAERAGFKYIWPHDSAELVYRDRLDDFTLVIKHLSISSGVATTVEQAADLSLPQGLSDGTVLYRSAKLVRSVRAPAKLRSAPAGVLVYQDNDEIFMAIGDTTVQITAGEGQCFLPLLAPDASKVLYQVLGKGLYVYDIATKSTAFIGRGDDATWAPDSRLILCERDTESDHDIASSDLYVMDLSGNETQLTATTDVLEMRPSWSSDGRYIAFDANGSIYIAEVSASGGGR